ncbi:MAG: hypothetical protein RSB54_00420 [Bacilli bacterium]
MERITLNNLLRKLEVEIESENQCYNLEIEDAYKHIDDKTNRLIESKRKALDSLIETQSKILKENRILEVGSISNAIKKAAEEINDFQESLYDDTIELQLIEQEKLKSIRTSKIKKLITVSLKETIESITLFDHNLQLEANEVVKKLNNVVGNFEFKKSDNLDFKEIEFLNRQLEGYKNTLDSDAILLENLNNVLSFKSLDIITKTDTDVIQKYLDIINENVIDGLVVNNVDDNTIVEEDNTIVEDDVAIENDVSKVETNSEIISEEKPLMKSKINKYSKKKILNVRIASKVENLNNEEVKDNNTYLIGYSLILEFVKKAEVTLDENDFNTAIKVVKNAPTLKKEDKEMLNRRLNKLENTFAFLDKAEATLNKVDYDYAEKMVKKPTIKEEDKEILVDRLYELNKVIKNKDQKANLEKENACVLASLTNLVEDAENVLNKEKLETAYEAINNYGLNREDIDPLLERLNIVEENINNNPNKYAESAEIVETYEVSKPDSLLVKLSVVIGDGIQKLFGIEKYLKSDQRLNRISKKVTNDENGFKYQEKLRKEDRPNSLKLYLDTQKLNKVRYKLDKETNLSKLSDLKSLERRELIKVTDETRFLIRNAFENKNIVNDANRMKAWLMNVLELVATSSNYEDDSYLAYNCIVLGYEAHKIDMATRLAMENQIKEIVKYRDSNEASFYNIDENEIDAASAVYGKSSEAKFIYKQRK